VRAPGRRMLHEDNTDYAGRDQSGNGHWEQTGAEVGRCGLERVESCVERRLVAAFDARI
jgi:hypothetical protein